MRRKTRLPHHFVIMVYDYLKCVHGFPNIFSASYRAWHIIPRHGECLIAGRVVRKCKPMSVADFLASGPQAANCEDASLHPLEDDGFFKGGVNADNIHFSLGSNACVLHRKTKKLRHAKSSGYFAFSLRIKHHLLDKEAPIIKDLSGYILTPITTSIHKTKADAINEAYRLHCEANGVGYTPFVTNRKRRLTDETRQKLANRMKQMHVNLKESKHHIGPGKGNKGFIITPCCAHRQPFNFDFATGVCEVCQTGFSI